MIYFLAEASQLGCYDTNVGDSLSGLVWVK